jgi:hypothetical protein
MDRVDIHEHGLSAGGSDRLDGGDERVRHRDHVRAGLDAERAESEPQRRSAVAHADAVLGAAELRKLLLELLELTPEGELPGVPETLEGLHGLCAHRPERARNVEERNRYTVHERGTSDQPLVCASVDIESL